MMHHHYIHIVMAQTQWERPINTSVVENDVNERYTNIVIVRITKHYITTVHMFCNVEQVINYASYFTHTHTQLTYKWLIL